MSSDLKVTNLKHASSSSNNLVLASDGTTTTTLSSSANIKSAINAGGSAPIYAVRAWANFNQATLNANGNISGVTDNGTGDYTVSFTTDMSDVNYSAVLTAETSGGYNVSIHTKAVGSFRVNSTYENSGSYDTPISLVVVR